MNHSRFIVLLAIVFTWLNMVKAQNTAHSFFDAVDIEIIYEKINTDASEIGPAFVENQLWYSAFSDKDIRRSKSGQTDKVFYKQFSSEIDKNGYIINNERIQLSDFETSFHEGPAFYASKTGELFLTLSNFIDVELEVDGLIVKRKRMRLRLVVAQLIENTWTIKEEMPFNDPVYSVGHPSATTTADTIFFTSDTPENNSGETDIYMAIRSNGKWGLPINLGANINSPSKEMFPFYHTSGMLIFASNRKGGKGGLDLYYSVLGDNGFSAAQPIEQLNSTADDFGLIIHDNSKLGYFVSNRSGFDADDNIFRVVFNEKLIAIKGSVTDKLTNDPIGGANVVLKDCNNNVVAQSNSAEEGSFVFENLLPRCYKVEASKQYYTTDEENVPETYYTTLQLAPSKELEVVVVDFDSRLPVVGAVISTKPNHSVTLNNDAIYYTRIENQPAINLETRAEGYLNQTKQISTNFEGLKRDTIFMMKRELNRTFVLENIYYDLDKWDILPESEIELDKLVAILKENPTVVVELGSHTDSRGSDNYNLVLSQRRSNSAVAYIVSKGIPKSNIVAKGYGETKLINHCKNGVWCSDNDHRINRRTEFKILSWD